MHSDRPAAEAAQLLNRYLIGLDDGKLDDAWARSMFTEDAHVEFPMSGHRGIQGLAAYHRDSLAAFARTQHLGSPVAVDSLGENQVRLRANLVSTHVHLDAAPGTPLFVTGTFVNGEARWCQDGRWRLSELSFRVVWMTGAPPEPGPREGGPETR